MERRSRSPLPGKPPQHLMKLLKARRLRYLFGAIGLCIAIRAGGKRPQHHLLHLRRRKSHDGAEAVKIREDQAPVALVFPVYGFPGFSPSGAVSA
jgi:hypothetical protein